MSTHRPDNRCPVCGRTTDVATLAYSEHYKVFACAACRAALSSSASAPAARPDDQGVAAAAVADEGDRARLAAAGPQRGRAPETASPRSTAPSGSKRSSPWPWVAGLALAAACVTTLVIVLVSRSGPTATTSADPRRAWEDANRDKIVAIKSEAEALTIADRLPEAHAKYRELEAIVAGRQIQDPRLMDLMDQARLDQSRVYTMILHEKNPRAVEPGPMPSSIEAQSLAAPTTRPLAQAATEPWSSPAPDAAVAGTPGPQTPALREAPSAPPVASAAPATPGRPEAPSALPAAPVTSTTPAPPASAPSAAAVAPPEAVVTPEIVEPSSAAPTPPAAPAAGAASSGVAPPVARPVAMNVDGRVTDAQVEQAIHRGVDFLIAQFQDGQIPRRQDTTELEAKGLNALALYALLSASQAVRDERLGAKGEFLTKAIDQLKASSLDPGAAIGAPATYARSLRASALAVYNRPQDRDLLQKDVQWLIRAAVDGAYTYDDRFNANAPPPPPLAPGAAPAPGGAARPGPATAPAQPGPAVVPPLPGTRTSLDADPTHTGPIHADPPNVDRAAGDFNDPSSVQPLGLWSGDVPLMFMHNGEVYPPPRPPPPPPPPPPPSRTPIYQLPRPNYRDTVGYLPDERPKYTAPFPWDNSNSQYGVLGVWAGAEVGVEVPDDYWKAVQQHWMKCQYPSGQWSYTPQFDPAYSMTVGGIASLLIAHDYLEAPLLKQRTAGRKPYDDFLTAGLAFLEDGDNAIDIMQTVPDAKFIVGYNLFGLERVGLASGLKYFGRHDWYAELAGRVVKLQHANGAWGRAGEGKSAIIDTAYVILFLSRGRHPVMMNKLRFDGFWTNRPRDAANLAAYAGREMERPVNWQVVNIDRTPEDWADSPILYLASNRAPTLSERDIINLRAFVENGGLLFTHADLGADAFNAFAAKLAKELFPGMALENLSPQHPVYSLNYKITSPRPRLQGVDNGVRLLMVHSPTDLSNAWQLRASTSRREAFQIAVNLYLYATGKERFRNRLDTPVVPEPPREPAPQIDIAQIQYDGDWNPEPAAWPRFGRVFQNRTGIRLLVHPAKPADLDPGKYLMAVMSGITGRTPTDADLAPVGRFVRDGGTLLVDSCGGSGAFATAVEAWLAKLEPAAKLQLLAKDDPLLRQTVPGTIDLPREQLRLFAIDKIGATGTRMKAMALGKGRVIFTPLDVTSGLLGTNTWGILGYLPEYAEAMMTNVVLQTSAAAK